MHNPFDTIVKRIGKEVLTPSGATTINEPIYPETQYADLHHRPDPGRRAERARLGLLGQLASVDCLIEVYSEPPGGEEFRACLSKHLAVWQQRAREERARKKRPEPRPPEAAEPFLWIIAAGTPIALLAKLKAEPAATWPAGIHLVGDEILRIGVVDASKLPRDSSTLLIRIMAGGRVMTRAIPELADLPADAYVRSVAEPLLLQYNHLLQATASLTPEQEEFLTMMLKTWEQLKTEARTEGRAEGRAEAGAKHLLGVLRVREIFVPETARERILAESDPETLERWLERAVLATSIADVFDAPK
jgi:hypothetical protein